jgi:hypothetical protein
MHMISCPKCGFEQPQDQFCAKCGVNMESFKPKIALGSGLSYLLKPVFFVLVIIGLIFLLVKNVENRIVAPEIQVEESTRIGSGAASLKHKASQPREAIPEEEVSDIEPTAALKPKAETRAAGTAAKEKEEAPSQKFDQVTASFSLAEHGTEEAAGKNSFLVPQAAPIYSSVTEEMLLKTGNNTFQFEDELIVYDLNFFVEEITDKNVTVKLNIKRTLRARTQDGSQTNSMSVTQKVPLDQTLIIIDALPRRVSIDRPNSILSTVYKSQSFLSHASELVQIIKFENPTNSPQEELTP